MNNRAFYPLICLLLFILLLTACQAQTAAPTATQPAAPPAATQTSAPRDTFPPSPSSLPSATQTRRPSSTPLPTNTAIPSFTPRPTATITPTPTEAPALSESRPYLVYYGLSGSQPAVILQNDNGIGRRVLPLPEGSQPPDLPGALSPDGRWLVFHTGTAGDPQALSQSKEPFNLALNLMHLPDGKVTPLTSLLTADYPESLKRSARQAAEKQPAGGIGEAQLYDEIWSRFLSGSRQAKWSPDGKTLAFAGQIEGLSLDLYFYDLAAGTIKRVAIGEEQLQWLHWSPDSLYLLHGRANRTCDHDCVTKYVLNVTSGEVRELSNLVGQGGSAAFYDWSGPHTLLFYTSASEQEPAYLKTIDVASDTASDLYPNAFVEFQMDPGKKLLALFLDIDVNPPRQIEQGIYLYRVGSGQRELVASAATYGKLLPVYWGSPRYPFLLWNEEKIYGLAEDGTVVPLAEGRFWGISRNRSWVVAADPKTDSPGLLLVNENGEVVRRASSASAGDLFWNTASTGLFSVYQGGLYYLDLQAENWVQLDSSLPAQNWSGPTRILYGWKK